MTVTVQIVADEDAPDEHAIAAWARAALEHAADDRAVTVRVVGDAEGRDLNARWRGRDTPTNVLAFPLGGDGVAQDLLGDVVVCAPVANAESGTDADARRAHWAHLVVHGTLHLLGHDHEDDADAARMEAAERTILAVLGYADPYR